MRKSALLVALALLGCAAAWAWWPHDAAVAGPQSAGVAPAGAARPADPASSSGMKWFDPVPDTAPADLPRVPLPPVDTSASAWLSLSEAREHGDPRTPPIVHEADARPAPTAAQLADPQAYQQYQEDQHTRLLNNFAAAAADALPKLQADLERGRQAGIPPDQLAKVEEKIARIQQLSAGITKDRPRN